jgi:hypothetical protein
MKFRAMMGAWLIVLLPACSSSEPAAAETDAAGEPQDAAAEEAAAEASMDSAPEAGPPSGLESVLGIWAKRTTGDAMIVKNTCGQFYMIDFDFKYTRFSQAGPTALKVEYCKDAACANLEPGVDKTLEYAGGKATYTKSDPMTLDPSCQLTVEDDGEIVFETTDYGRFRWTVGLTYTGSGCAPYKDAKMTGDTCEGIAESELDRVP